MNWLMPRPAVPTNRARPGMRPTRARSAPVNLYTRAIQTALTGGQVSGVVPESGELALSVGPSGLGTVWYPASAVISTTVGPLDPSTCAVYVGPQGNPQALQGTLFASGGAGTVALAIPQLTPGLFIVAIWTGATPGSVATMNVTGTAQMLTRPQ
jgi:hypothetical protein